MNGWLAAVLAIVVPHVVLALYVFAGDLNRMRTYGRYPGYHRVP